jgi:hypothetical protein
VVYVEEVDNIVRRFGRKDGKMDMRPYQWTAGRICDDIDERHGIYPSDSTHLAGLCLIDRWIDLSVHFSGVPIYSIILALACGFGFGVGAFDAIPIDVFLLSLFVRIDE